MAKNLQLKFYPDDILRQKAKDVDLEFIKTSEFAQLIVDMEKTMNTNNGIGLAAPQIGKSIRVAIIKTEDGALPLVNPKIVKKSLLKKETEEEGCLSIPGVYGDVRRHYSIKVSTLTPEGKEIKFNAKGLFARVIQHEIDHLDGVLFIDKTLGITKGQDILDEMEGKK